MAGNSGRGHGCLGGGGVPAVEQAAGFLCTSFTSHKVPDMDLQRKKKKKERVVTCRFTVDLSAVTHTRAKKIT